MQGDLISRELSVHNIARHKVHILANGDIPKDLLAGENEGSFIRGLEYGMKLAQDLVFNQPTAYSVEDVVAELEENIEKQKGRSLNGNSYRDGLKEGLEIVRNGGKE